MMYFHLDAEARSFFTPHYPVQPPLTEQPVNGLSWHVHFDQMGTVPVCVLIEHMTRYALVFTWTGPQFARHLPQILTRRLTTHLMLLQSPDARTTPMEVKALTDLYRQLMEELTESITFLPEANYDDPSVETTWHEIRATLQARETLPKTQEEMIALEIELNRQTRPVGQDDSILPWEAFQELMGLYVSTRLMKEEEAERFLNHLGQAVGLAAEPLARPEKATEAPHPASS